MKKIALVVPCYNEEAVLPRTAEDILKVKPDAKLYLLADTQHAYNLQNFSKRKDRFVLQPLAKFSMPSFATGKPADVHLCKIVVK